MSCPSTESLGFVPFRDLSSRANPPRPASAKAHIVTPASTRYLAHACTHRPRTRALFLAQTEWAIGPRWRAAVGRRRARGVRRALRVDDATRRPDRSRTGGEVVKGAGAVNPPAGLSADGDGDRIYLRLCLSANHVDRGSAGSLCLEATGREIRCHRQVFHELGLPRDRSRLVWSGLF